MAQSDIAVLEIQVKTSGVGAANTGLNALDRNSSQVQGKFGKLQGAATKMNQTFQLASGVIRAVSGAIRAVGNALNGYLDAAGMAEETGSKFEAVFDEIGVSAEQAATAFADSFGLAESTAKQMLSATGDILSGLGATDQIALDTSVQINALAADLASFQNLSGGAERASEALEKAFLGQYQEVRALGIILRAEAVDQELVVRGQNDLTGVARELARGQIALSMAMEQSKNAMGDYARTQDSFTNISRRLEESQKSLQEEMGRKLLPMAGKIKEAWGRVIEKMRDAIKHSNDLKDALDALEGGRDLTVDEAIAVETQKMIDAKQMLAELQLLISDRSSEQLKIQLEENKAFTTRLKLEGAYEQVAIQNAEEERNGLLSLYATIKGQENQIKLAKEMIVQIREEEEMKIRMAEKQEMLYEAQKSYSTWMEGLEKRMVIIRQETLDGIEGNLKAITSLTNSEERKLQIAIRLADMERKKTDILYKQTGLTIEKSKIEIAGLKRWGENTELVKEQEDLLVDQISYYKTIGELLGLQAGEVDNLIKAQDEYNEKIESTGDAWDGLPKKVRLIAGEVEELSHGLGTMHTMIETTFVHGWAQIEASYLKSIEEMSTGTKEWGDQFLNTLINVGIGFVASGITESFEAIGEALFGSKDAAENLGEALVNLAGQILNALPLMFVQAGLQAIIMGNLAVGIVLLGLGGVTAIGAGIFNAVTADERTKEEATAEIAAANAHLLDRDNPVPQNTSSRSPAVTNVMVINNNVQGSIMTERQIAGTITKQQMQMYRGYR